MAATILCIDDQEDNLALLEAVLEPQGFAYHGATDGLSGLARARELHPDLVLLDLAMPGMDGFEVLTALREDAVTRRIPVIVLTANLREAKNVERGFELGATEYLTKPIQMDELLVRIRTTLRLAHAERELDRLRRDFASMLVHDMRAPLDGVRLALGTLKRQEAADSARAELLALALGSLEDIGNLVEDLLNVNRLEEEGFSAEPRLVDVGEMIASSLRNMRAIAEARGLSLSAEVPAVPQLAWADARLLRRVLDNLVANALKFTDEGSVVVSVRPLDGQIELAVADTGPGIPADVLPRVFDRYYHLERRRSTRQGGFGLGLAFCERAVNAMGGKIDVQSEVGRGSTFRVLLPVAEDEKGARHASDRGRGAPLA